uniref:Oxidoreductase-like domain-containing protein n=1 Tax=Anopheles coluzzii TaxID=1518534 RepID=A0A8W7P3S6_ANOCL
MNCVILNAIRNAQLRNVAYRFCSSSTNGPDRTADDSVPELPPEPTTCCMSGCQNCVWIQYAADLTKILDDGGEKAREIVLEKISDPSLKMFLKMELQNMPPSKNDPT